MVQIADMIQGWMIPLDLQHATKPCGLWGVMGATKTLNPVILFGPAFFLVVFLFFHIFVHLACRDVTERVQNVSERILVSHNCERVAQDV